MQGIIKQFLNYIWLLVKTWTLLLFLILDGIGAFVDIFLSPGLQLPRLLYETLAFVGLLIAGFQVYRDLIAQMPLLEARAERLAEKAAESFGYWCFWNERTLGGDDQELLSDWLIARGVDDVKRDFGVLCKTIDMLKAKGAKVEHILDSEFDILIREHDNPPRFEFNRSR